MTVPHGQACRDAHTASGKYVAADAKMKAGKVSCRLTLRPVLSAVLPANLLFPHTASGRSPQLSQRSGMRVLLAEQHIGFALNAADSYYVLAAGRVSSRGAGGARAAGQVCEAMLI